jgi:hypothetical protein
MLTKVLGTTQVLTATSTASTSTAFTGYSKVRIASTVSVFVAIGKSPVATSTSSFILPANTAEHFSINKGISYPDYSTATTVTITVPADKVSVLAVGGTGVVSITPIA